jgi:hypothetical protein
MAKVEIDESVWANTAAVEAAVSQMLAHPKARKMLLQARKEADPKAVIPELDAAEPINSELAEMRRMLAEDRAAREAEKAAAAADREAQKFQRDWDRQKSRLRDAGWQDQGIDKVEKFAAENGIGDLTIAADAWEKRNPPPEPATPNGTGSWNFFDAPTQEDEKFMKAMIESRGDDERALDSEIRASLTEFRAQNAPAARRGW